MTDEQGGTERGPLRLLGGPCDGQEFEHGISVDEDGFAHVYQVTDTGRIESRYQLFGNVGVYVDTFPEERDWSLP